MKRVGMNPRLLTATLWLLVMISVTAHAQKEFPDAVKIVPPDDISTQILSAPKPGAEMLELAYSGDILEKLGEAGDYVKVQLPGKKQEGFVLKAHTVPWDAPSANGLNTFYIALIGAGIALAVIIGIGLLLWYRRSSSGSGGSTDEIADAIKNAERLFRAGDYSGAATQFRHYLQLQGGEVRNPDVYRRLTVCAQKTGDLREAVNSWERMRTLGGLKTVEDYTLGAEIMVSLGEEEAAARIYEQLLEHEQDEAKRTEIRRTLANMYLRLKNCEKLVQYLVELLDLNEDVDDIVDPAVSLLIEHEKTDLAIQANNRYLVSRIRDEFLEEEVKTPEAAAIYLKCLEYDRTDIRLHRIIADYYIEQGDFKQAVSELIYLNQLDKDNPDAYMDEAARLYVDNSIVQHAIAEGNPTIIKKIAQIYLMSSQVTPDAVSIYEKVLEFQPHAVGINKMLRTVYMTRGDLDKYIEKLRLLQEIDGDNESYLDELAQCVVDNDLFEQTIREGNRDLNTKILKKLMDRGAHDDRSIGLFERLIKYEPKSVAIRRTLAQGYDRRGEHESSLKHWIALCKTKPDDGDMAQATAKYAVGHRLFRTVAAEATGAVLTLVAHAIVKGGIEGEGCRQVLEKALKENPKDQAIQAYLRNLGTDSKKKT